MQTLKAIVTGRVQMVMFRDFVQRKARGLSLVGTVRNLEDGTVEVVAAGERELLEKLLGYLHRGSILSRVDAVSVTWDNQVSMFSDFTILY